MKLNSIPDPPGPLIVNSLRLSVTFDGQTIQEHLQVAGDRRSPDGRLVPWRLIIEGDKASPSGGHERRERQTHA